MCDKAPRSARPQRQQLLAGYAEFCQGLTVRDAVANVDGLYFQSATDTLGTAYVGNTWVFPVTAGTRRFHVRMFGLTGGDPMDVEAAATAIFTPFGATGGSTLGGR